MLVENELMDLLDEVPGLFSYLPGSDIIVAALRRYNDLVKDLESLGLPAGRAIELAKGNHEFTRAEQFEFAKLYLQDLLSIENLTSHKGRAAIIIGALIFSFMYGMVPVTTLIAALIEYTSTGKFRRIIKKYIKAYFLRKGVPLPPSLLDFDDDFFD